MGKEVVTQEVRLSYANVYEPRSINGGAPKYSCVLLIDKTDTDTLGKINEAVAQLIQEEQKTLGTTKGLKLPLRDGDEEKEDPEYAGKMFMNVSNTKVPILLQENGQRSIDPRDMYSGCYARVAFDLFAYNKAGNKGIGAGLKVIKKERDGEPLGGMLTEAEALSKFNSLM